MAVKIEDVVKKYIELRDTIDQRKKVFEAEIEPIKKAMDDIERWLLNRANELGVDSFKTEYGTAFTKTSEFVSVGVWDETLKYIQDNNAWGMLNRAVNKTAVLEYVSEHKIPPPGVNYIVKKEVQIRRP